MSLSKNLPKTCQEWKQAARSHRLLTKSLSTLPALPSASKMTVKEYLAMRVLRPKVIPINRFPIEDHIAERVDQIQLDFNELRLYEAHVGTQEDPSQHAALGAFQLVRDAQLEVLNIAPETSRQSAGPVFRPSRASQPGAGHTGVGPEHAQSTGVSVASSVTSVPTILTAAADVDYVEPSRTADEQIVNESLMNLLKTLTMRIPSVACRWSSGRRPFNAVSFGNNQLIAYTDGYLVAPHNREVFAVVGVKAMTRDRKKHPEVLWQEAAEMVAWIMNDANSRECPLEQRIIVSQANSEIYITMANYDQDYLDYLQGQSDPRRNDSPESFLRMTEYGPWRIDNRSNMHHLAQAIMAFCLQVTDGINRLRGSPGQSM
ncbi:unnamed protein product [Penicillium salamii]|uniref:Uncharacterized protein n=1 Tax=Penicillium salamii TaxID=1612424 RepID=A0A9W4NEI5_9EURO|nr:unnamed protein product [Penicillium salamii]